MSLKESDMVQTVGQILSSSGSIDGLKYLKLLLVLKL